MQTFEVFKETTGLILPIMIYDASSSVGAGLAGITFESEGLEAYYHRFGAVTDPIEIELVTCTKGTFSSGGFIVQDGIKMKGHYELHVPNAALVTGADYVNICVYGAADMVPVNVCIHLISATRGLAGTALPDAAADDIGGLPISDAGGLDLDTLDANVAEILADTGTDGVKLASDYLIET